MCARVCACVCERGSESVCVCVQKVRYEVSETGSRESECVCVRVRYGENE